MNSLAFRNERSGGNLARCRAEGQRFAPALFLLVAFFLTAAAACAPRARRPPGTEIETASHRAYQELTESLGIDRDALKGRIVILDPGHGGGYRGSMGLRGAAEADVNLAVALFLWGLLADAGADVHLTRTADRDFVGGELQPATLAPAESLRADLAARMARANTLAADLFLSVHHNADASGDTTRNQTLTFYRLGDAGPSLDAAQAIHRHLMRNLNTASGQVLSGNYHVLRNSTAAAAVLGEPSFLTNPIFEEKLVRIDRVELEATAYFLGIVDYFSRGTARVAALTPADTVLDAATTDCRADFIGAAIDPATVEFRMDGTVMPATPVAPRPGAAPASAMEQGAAFAAAHPGPLANGRHELQVHARCLGGNAVPPGAAVFQVRRPPAEIRAEPWPAWNGRERPGPLGLRVTVRDRLGLAVADSTPVDLLAPRSARTLTRDGEAWFQLGEEIAPAGAWRVRSAQVEATAAVVTAGAPRAWSGQIKDASTGQPVAGAELRDGEGGLLLGRTTAEGGFAVRAPIHELVIRAPGYLPERLVGQWSEPVLRPVLGGVLHGRVIAVDAAGGGSEPLAVSTTGLRASDTALDLARRLAVELRAAGAHAALIREDDRTLPDLARVEAAERVEAEIVLRLAAGREARVRHYPGSDRGMQLAGAIAREMAAEAGLSLPVRAEVTPILQQTSMPAVELLLPAPGDAATEEQHLDPDFRRRLARALLLALAVDAGLDPAAQGTAMVTSTAPRVLVDGATVLPTGRGPLILRFLEPSPANHRLAGLDAAGRPREPLEFSVAGGDTVRLTLP